MDSVRVVLDRYFRAIWRHRWLGVGIAWLTCGIGWIGVQTIPNQFESSGRLYVDADAVLTPLLRGLAADSAPITQLEVLQRTLLSRPNLEKLISKTDLDVSLKGPSDRERLLSRLASDIKVNPQTKNLFTINYRNASPKLAHDVVQTLLTIFIEGATGSSRTDMENARRFLERQIQSYEEQLRAAEKRRASFRERYVDVLPADNTPNVPALEGARNAVQQLEGRLQDARVARETLRQEVERTPALLVVEPSAANAPGSQGGHTQLQDATDQLHLLLLHDTDQHPDVIAQRRLIEVLRKAPGPQAGRLADAKNLDNGRSQRSLPNPVYDQLKIRLIDADTNLNSLQRQRDEAVQYRDRLEKVQHEQPGLIAEYQNMDRDYNVLRHSYEELLGRLQSANIAQAADMQADKVKLQIIDPPEIARLPVAPNRMLLISAVLLGGIICGIATTILIRQLDNSFSSVEELRALGLPVLGGISVVDNVPVKYLLISVLQVGTVLVALVGVYGVLIMYVLRSSALI